MAAPGEPSRVAWRRHADGQQVDADVVQIDEVHVTGHADEAAICAAGVSRVLDGVKTEKAVYVCYGNYGGQTIQQGT